MASVVFFLIGLASATLLAIIGLILTGIILKVNGKKKADQSISRTGNIFLVLGIIAAILIIVIIGFAFTAVFGMSFGL